MDERFEDLVILYMHHVHDALEALKKDKLEVVEGSLLDLEELSERFLQYVEPGERDEIEDIAESITMDPDIFKKKKKARRKTS